MKKLFVISALFLVLINNMLAQDWQLIRDSATAYFEHQSIWAIRVDSVREIMGNRYYYSFNSPKVISSYQNESYNIRQCIYPNGPSRIGKYMIADQESNIFINNRGDSIRFRTNLQPGIPWQCCSINDSSYLEAIVSQVIVEPVLGITDSVKYISFQARNNSGSAVNHPLNNETLKISKHLGLLTLFDFRTFPDYYADVYPVHMLSGFHSPVYSLGERKLTWKEIYEFSPGDEFHTVKRTGWGPNNSADVYSTVKVVLDSSWNQNGDFVTYRIKRNYSYYDAAHFYLYYYADTISDSYGFTPAFAAESEESYLTVGFPSIADKVSSMRQYHTDSYNSRRQLFTNASASYDPDAPCADTLYSGNIWEPGEDNFSSFVEGCGGAYYMWCDTNFYMGKYVCHSYNLVYFKKGNETWGTKLDSAKWIKPYSINPDVQIPAVFSIYPNPVLDKAEIQIHDTIHGDFTVEIADLYGKTVMKYNSKASVCQINLAGISNGVYILRLFRKREFLGMQRIIKI